jgi:hypothetical protein
MHPFARNEGVADSTCILLPLPLPSSNGGLGRRIGMSTGMVRIVRATGMTDVSREDKEVFVW